MNGRQEKSSRMTQKLITQLLVWRANNSKRIYKFLHIKFGRYRSNDIRLK